MASRGYVFVGVEAAGGLYAGESVRGVVVVVVPAPALSNALSSALPNALPNTLPNALSNALVSARPVRRVTVALHGTERTRWTPLVSVDPTDELVGHAQVPGLAQSAVVLFSDDSSGGGAGLAPGTHTFAFELALPPSVPRSYSEAAVAGPRTPSMATDWYLPGKTSWAVPVWIDPASGVEYTVTATTLTDGPPGTAALVRERAQSVGLAVWERVDPALLSAGPVTHAASKTFFLGGKEPLELRATLPHAVYFVGDAVTVQVHLRNQSQKTVDAVVLRLRTYVTYRATGDQTLQRELHTEATRHAADAPAGVGVVGPQQEANFELAFRPLVDVHGRPRNEYASLTGGCLVAVRHELTVEACVAKGFNLAVTLPIHLVARAPDRLVRLADLARPVKAPAPVPKQTGPGSVPGSAQGRAQGSGPGSGPGRTQGPLPPLPPLPPYADADEGFEVVDLVAPALPERPVQDASETEHPLPLPPRPSAAPEWPVQDASETEHPLPLPPRPSAAPEPPPHTPTEHDLLPLLPPRPLPALPQAPPPAAAADVDSELFTLGAADGSADLLVEKL